MKNSVFLNFVFLMLFKHKSKHIPILIISTLIVFLCLTSFFIKDSLQNSLYKTLENHNDFIVKNSFNKDISLDLISKLKKIRGISNTKQRVYGQYKFLSEDIYFTIIGLENFDKDSIIIGNGVKKILNKYHFFNEFSIHNKSFKIKETLEKEENLIANDVIIMNLDIAKELLQIDKEFASDIGFDVRNELERANIREKIFKLDNNLKIIEKTDIKKSYENIFNYKGGFFLTLFTIVIFTLSLIVFQRYSQISSNEKKQIAILKALGFSIKDIIKIKMAENFILSFVAFLLGLIFAFIFVFVLQAPIFKYIFIGFSNIENDFIFDIYFDISSIITIFLFFMIPFLSAVLIPTWKTSAINAYESLK
ncbi:ABC transporter permease [Arcobacter vandammei]|uniref:ABC transporter permease n=1 Tax=Arcobacter vandammei TaxID=2782243 RepID=UPI0018DFC807|nr:FtsX-like permease family protein [Arcobacter vandammei]